LSAAFQNPSALASASSAAICARLPSMSKMPPENLEAARELRDAFPQGPDFHGGEVYTRISATPDQSGVADSGDAQHGLELGVERGQQPAEGVDARRHAAGFVLGVGIRG
jgi:hypothetical protein